MPEGRSGCEPDPNHDSCSCSGPDQAVLGISEEAIVRIQEAGICLGRLHRLCLMEGVHPSKVQLAYLEKATSELESLVTVINHISDSLGPARHA